MRRAVLAAAVAASASAMTAHAPDAHAGRKRVEVAQALSGIGAGLSAALTLSSLYFKSDRDSFNKWLFYPGLASSVITPSLGEWYVGEIITPGEYARLAGAGVITGGSLWTQTTSCPDSAMGGGCKALTTGGFALIAAGAIAYLGGAVYDLLDVSDAVDRWDAKHRVMVTPEPIITPTGGTGGGVFLSGTF